MSTSTNIRVFPTLIQHTNNFLHKTECDKIIKNIPSANFSNHLCLKGKGKSTHKVNSSILSIIGKDILKKINTKIEEYVFDYGVKPLKIDNSWVNIQNKNSVLTKHSHPDSIVSGVLYLKADNKSSKIYFYNPNVYRTFVDFIKQTEYNSDSYFFTPQIGDLILFPSWLMHGSKGDKNNSAKRIAFSFNTLYR
tara:strand:+ start:3541 stop:4119 length:579 start_codon:yes stop_codon:yes gene_type:complete